MGSISAALTVPTPGLPNLCFRLRACIFSELLRTPSLPALRMGALGADRDRDTLARPGEPDGARAGTCRGGALEGAGPRGGVRGLAFPRATESARRAWSAGSCNYAEMRRGVEGKAQGWGAGHRSAQVRAGTEGVGGFEGARGRVNLGAE